MKCPNCGSKLKNVMVSVEDAKSKAASLQCLKCEYIDFDKESTDKVIEEIKQKNSIRKTVS